MNSVEDRLHAAMAAAADQADREIRTALPLRLPPEQAPGARRGRALRQQTQRRWIRWAAPFTAAAAVVALAVSLVLVKGTPNGSVFPPNPGPSTAPATSAAPGGIPRYYVAITRQGGIVAGDSVTGATLGAVAPPAGLTFRSVTAAADDRTFVVFAITTDSFRATETPAGVKTAPATGSWYELRLAPATGHPPVLTPLPVKPQTVHGLAALDAFASALSRSGGELAITEATASGGLAVRVFSVATGQPLHDWITNDPSLSPSTSDTKGLSGAPSLTWLDGDRVLAVGTASKAPVSKSTNPFLGFGARNIVRELTVAGPSAGDLLADSKVVWNVQTWEYPVNLLESCTGQRQGAQLVSADGSTLGCLALTRGTHPNLSFLTYPLTTGPTVAGQARIAYKVPWPAKTSLSMQVLWISPSGDALIGEWITYAIGTGAAPANDLHVGVMSHGKFTPLRFPPGFDREALLTTTTITW